MENNFSFFHKHGKANRSEVIFLLFISQNEFVLTTCEREEKIFMHLFAYN